MQHKTFYVGNTPLQQFDKEVKGEFVTLNGERFYQIDYIDAMQPFFISVASETNLWMYLSSTGGLTAGRTSPDMALFPYYTDDKITESSEITGSKTIIRATFGDKTYLWEPFSVRAQGLYAIKRSVAKSTIGNKILFTEVNETLQLSFSYMYMNADQLGWIKKSTISNLTDTEVGIELIDGLQNILPAGTNRITQNTYSTLVDAYKRTELVSEVSLVLFRMESIMVDKAEPSESLKVNTVWSYGLPDATYMVSSMQLDAFRMGLDVHPEMESKGVKGAILAHDNFTLATNQVKQWYFVADVQKDAVGVRNLIQFIKQTPQLQDYIETEVAKGTQALKAIVAQVDGVQQTADEHGMARHFANTLFNTMRGGFYCDEYTIVAADFVKHVNLFNKAVAKQHQAMLASLPTSLLYAALEEKVKATGDAQLYRLFQEYLPITFSRRHGDPSRPWNLFHIRVNDDNGNKIISYQGNWRDIFQNWEALSLSYPAYINGIIAKFLNATTADGYNPYKVTSEGIDWEVIVPEDPWSNIGYWGDHQIIYLLKLMELSHKYYPQALDSYLNREMFSYAQVPYRIKSYQEIVQDPRNTISFDQALHDKILAMQPAYGSDARLMLDESNQVVLVSFTEKILATLLAKLSNFIPQAGIWLNTMRPEWNDANNALVGIGASMVTLYYIRRFVAFVSDLYAKHTDENFVVSAEIKQLFVDEMAAFEDSKELLPTGFNAYQRRVVIDALGKAATQYRQKVYAGLTGNKTTISTADLLAFFQLVLAYLDQSIAANQRADGMYHAYNLVRFEDDTVQVDYLYEMLEGQVAVLSALQLSPLQVADMLDAMRQSALYRPDQQSYTLYPNKQLPAFLEKNNIPAQAVESSAFIQKALQEGDTRIVCQDKMGGVHFNATFNNAEFLAAALDKMGSVSPEDRKYLLDLYEQMFNHNAFTGRSGTFYKYEGLGSIYWHMVSKLLVAIHENILKAIEEKADKEVLERLKAHYAAVKWGIGAHKSPKDYGSFPFDAYSHTPAMAGVQQPGMTGQVKEDLLNRFFELGIRVNNGKLSIATDMLNKDEFVDNTLCFTYCAVPFVYVLGTRKGIDVEYCNGTTSSFANNEIDQATSAAIFARTKDIKQIIVHLSL